MVWQIRSDGPTEIPVEDGTDLPAAGVPAEGAPELRALLTHGEIVLGVSALAIVTAILPLVLVPLAAAAMVGIRALGRRAHFGFGDGFLGFDDRVRWPRGVQEDDEVRWHWTG